MTTGTNAANLNTSALVGDLVAAFLARGGKVQKVAPSARALPQLTERDWADIVRGNATVEELTAPAAPRQPQYAAVR